MKKISVFFFCVTTTFSYTMDSTDKDNGTQNPFLPSQHLPVLGCKTALVITLNSSSDNYILFDPLEGNFPILTQIYCMAQYTPPHNNSPRNVQ